MTNILTDQSFDTIMEHYNTYYNKSVNVKLTELKEVAAFGCSAFAGGTLGVGASTGILALVYGELITSLAAAGIGTSLLFPVLIPASIIMLAGIGIGVGLGIFLCNSVRRGNIYRRINTLTEHVKILKDGMSKYATCSYSRVKTIENIDNEIYSLKIEVGNKKQTKLNKVISTVARAVAKPVMAIARFVKKGFSKLCNMFKKGSKAPSRHRESADSSGYTTQFAPTA